MSSAGPDIAGSTAEAGTLQAWEAVRNSADIQFAPLPPVKPPETPGWLSVLGEERLAPLLEFMLNAAALSTLRDTLEEQQRVCLIAAAGNDSGRASAARCCRS